MSTAAQRRKTLRDEFERLEVDALLVTDEKNVTWLTGFTGDSSPLLLDREGDLIISDSRYTTQLADECPGLPVAARDARHTLKEFLSLTLGKRPIQRLGVEADTMTLAVFEQLREATSTLELVATQGVVIGLRAKKDPDEIALIRHAAHIAEAAFLSVTAALRANQSERDVAFDLEHTIRALGGDGCSFPPIVAVGDNAARPHAVPSQRKLSEHPLLLIDWGAVYQGYRSDITRVLYTGEAEEELNTIYRVVWEAQQAAIAKIAPGVVTNEVDAAARDHSAQAGYGDYFGHGLGHGIGLNIHEEPRFSPRIETKLEPGMVVTVEPGIYLPGRGGVRLEDDVLVTETGHEVLSTLPKDRDWANTRLH